MNKQRLLHLAFSFVGLAALTAYILACKPAFSPDGTKVLIPVVGPKEHWTQVLLFDLNRQKFERVFEFYEEDGMVLPAVMWLPDGKRAAFVCAVDTRYQVVVSPLGAPGCVRVFALPEQGESKDDLATLRMSPPPLIGRRLYLPGKPLTIVDLDTGETDKSTTGEGLVLTAHADQLYYLDPEEGQIGRLDPKTLWREPLAQLETTSKGKLSPFLAVSPDGQRLAVGTDKSEGATVMVIRDKKVETTWTAPSRMQVGNLEWAPSGKALYAAYLEPDAQNTEGYQVGAVRISLTGEPVQRIPLAWSKSDDAVLAVFQVALSPDGRTLLASTAALEPEGLKPERPGLCVIDLSRTPAKVQRVPLPAWAQPQPVRMDK